MVYSEAFIEQVLFKVYSRGPRSVKSVAEDLNVSYHKVKYWMKVNKSRAAGGASSYVQQGLTTLPDQGLFLSTQPLSVRPCG